MMPIYFTPQGPGQLMPVPAPGHPHHHHGCQHHLVNTVTPPKRPVGDNDDDDIEFISEKPVKRRKTSQRQPEAPMTEQPMMPFATTVIPNIPMAQMQLVESDLRDAERRLSTGMVGLPSDLHAMELTYALRGVSMPVLEKFVLNQPPRKPRPLSPPELSPKQLPTEIPPAEVNIQTDQNKPPVSGHQTTSSSPVACSRASRISRQAEKPVTAPNLTKTTPGSSQGPLANSKNHPKPCSDHVKGACVKSAPMPPPPPPPPNPSQQRSEASKNIPCPESSPTTSETHRHNHNSPAHAPKQPCQACTRLRHQAQLSRAQGIPMMNAGVPPHFMPQLHCPPPYGAKMHPQVVAMPTSNMHHFTPNFAPVMVPVSNNPFAPLPPHPQHPPAKDKAAAAPSPRKEPEKEKQKPPSKKPQSPAVSKPAAAASPPKPFIQPTYRKPSPNLIVDVAETCQEKFPFEEVAQRHSVPVEKVFDVFAAIIQVPLLRCPTDRRRAGRLATARIKEYNKAKKAIRDSRAEGGKVEKQASAKDVAKRLGPVEVPEGFTDGDGDERS
ncbi:hypothetical protein F4861DRAFT_372187 [Xylaria intraflava]|nr:hypothetical protein F4861DRAFT_372187 [Xylaria intraflava]